MKKTSIITFVVSVLIVLTGIIYTSQRLKNVTFQEEKFLNNIDSDIEIIEFEINEVRSEYEQFGGGLVKNILKTRLEILNATNNLLQQRRLARKYYININYEGSYGSYGTESEKQELIEQLNDEIEKQKTELIKNQAKSEMYTAGLFKSMLEASVATVNLNIYLLETKKLALKYDLPFFVSTDTTESDIGKYGSGSNESEKGSEFTAFWIKTKTVNIRNGPSKNDSIITTLKQGDKVYLVEKQNDWYKVKVVELDLIGWVFSNLLSDEYVAPQPKFDILNVDTRVTESNDVWWKYAWQFTVKNSDSESIVFSATIEFLDKDGFVIDTDCEYNLYVPGNKEKTFRGYALINIPGATKVAQVSVKTRQ
ncbi:MAG: SH3 domain-containing protein [candidate division Zixibacteria bacterium]|nr:SH3 domain-containing protein [Candidatus Tariuqbacter arcticus]